MKIFILILVVLLGCTQKDKYPIRDLEAGPDFYITLLNEVRDQLERSKGDKQVDLLYKKIFISQQLRWPEDISAEIVYLTDREGLNYELYQYATDFYESVHYYERLLNIVNKWTAKHKATFEDHRYRFLALKGLNREAEAKHLLWNLLQNVDQKDALKFIAGEYLHFQDTARALYTYARLARHYPDEEVLRAKYIPLLIDAGYSERARDLLIAQSDMAKDPEAQVLMAKILYNLGEPYRAIEILRKQNQPEHYLQLARWFQSSNNYDSAIYYTDLLIRKDSSRRALLAKGDIYEQRGWLNSAYETFIALVIQDSTDSVAATRADIVARKIAYLRRKREAEKEIPILNIPIKKSTENE